MPQWLLLDKSYKILILIECNNDGWQKTKTKIIKKIYSGKNMRDMRDIINKIMTKPCKAIKIPKT